MKKLILVVALLTMVAFVSGVMAQGKPAPAPAPAKPAATAAPAPAATPAPAKPAKAEKFSGTVDKVDEAAKAIVIKGKKSEKTIVIDDKTKITKGGKEMAFADLKMGMNVSVEYKKDGDKMVATTVKASAPKAAKAKAEKPAEAPTK
jgi:hypothetical protein